MNYGFDKNSSEKEDKKRMCKKLNEISGMTPAKILEKYSTAPYRYAVSMSDLMKNLDIPIIEYDFTLSNPIMQSDNFYNKGHIIGAIVLLKDDLCIFVSDKCSEEEKRYIIAHEIGHCCLHSATLKTQKIEFAKDSTSNNPHEIEADNFAMDLLLPEGNVRYVYNQLIVKSLDALASAFCVPISFMRKRLELLNLKYI